MAEGKKSLREPISKKLRFEVFKRDGFTCQYCGQHPPSVTLEIDHIKPVSKKGSNDVNNLVTSCFDCNRGKSNVLLTEITPTLKDSYNARLERVDQLKEFEKLQKRIRTKITKDCNKVDKLYGELCPNWVMKEQFKRVSVRKFIEKLGLHEVMDSMEIAASKINDPNEVLRYFCGICWAKIRGDEIT